MKNTIILCALICAIIFSLSSCDGSKKQESNLSETVNIQENNPANKGELTKEDTFPAAVSVEEEKTPTSTPSVMESKILESDFSFTLNEIGHPDPLDDKIVPFEQGEITRNFLYLVTSPNWGWDYLGFAEPQAVRSRTFTSILKAMMRNASEEGFNNESEIWIKNLDTDTRDWLNTLMEFANEKKFRYDDNTLQWVLVYTEFSGKPEFYSPLDILTIKKGSKYTFLTKDKFSDAPQNLWDDIEKGFRYFDVTNPEDVEEKCNYVDFISYYSQN